MASVNFPQSRDKTCILFILFMFPPCGMRLPPVTFFIFLCDFQTTFWTICPVPSETDGATIKIIPAQSHKGTENRQESLTQRRRGAKNSLFYHRVHRGHRDKTSQRIIAGVPRSNSLTFFSLCVFCAFALNHSPYSLVPSFPLFSLFLLFSLYTPAQRATLPIQSNPLCLSRL